MKINGQHIQVRGSNKAYTKFDDLDWLFEQLDVSRGNMTMAELAEKEGIPLKSRNIIRHRVEKYFPPEWKAQIKRARKPHSKTRNRNKID